MLRRITLFHGTQGYVLPSLPLAALAAADPTLNPLRVVNGTLQLRRGDDPARHLRRGGAPVPGERRADLRVIPFYEAAAAAAGTPGSRWLARDVAGKTIFVGSASALSADYAFTPGRPAVRAADLRARLREPGRRTGGDPGRARDRRPALARGARPCRSS